MSVAAVPERLGKYEVRGVLGRGAMGVVYDGWDPIIHRRVAIKTVRLPAADDEAAQDELDRFRREAQAAGRLTHTNIVGVFDYGETADVAFIVMEYVEGNSLKARLDADPHPALADTLRIMGDVLAGLAFSHARGVVHRDIKPANVMLTPEGQAKIADFGIARIEASSMTQAGTVLGTPAYMSPEQFAGQVVDGRTDIYACGVMLYQLLTGERPFDGSMTSIMHKAMTVTPPAPSVLAVTAPRTLDGVVARAMARRPDDRFATAAEFAAALNGAPLTADVDDDATMIARPTSPPPAPPPAPAPAIPAASRGSRVPLVAALGGGTLIVAAVAAFLLLRPGSEVPASQTASPAVVASTPRTEPSVPAVAPTPVPAAPSITQAFAPPPAPVTPSAPAALAPSAPAATAPSAPATLAPSAPELSTSPAVPVAPPAATEPAPVVTRNVVAIPCSLVQGSGSGRSAYAGSESLAELGRALGPSGPEPRPIDPPFCPVLDLFRQLGLTASTDGLALTQDSGTAPLHDDELIALHAAMPGFAGFLSLAYVQHDGSVETLVPGPGYPVQTLAARANVPLGQPGGGSPGWRVGPPFGTDMIVAFASTAPLFATAPASGLGLTAYLAEVRIAVDALRRRGGTVAAAVLPLDTRPPR